METVLGTVDRRDTCSFLPAAVSNIKYFLVIPVSLVKDNISRSPCVVFTAEGKYPT